MNRLFLLASLVSAAATIGAAEPGPFNSILQKSIDSHIVTGAVALVADKDHVLDLESVGNSSANSPSPISTDAIFFIASMTKSFTGAAVMMLVDEGKMTLDDPVEKYLPEFKGQMVVEDKQPPHPPKHPITVREIMSHTSGICATNNPALKHAYSLQELTAQYAALPLQWEPGSRYRYDGPGINTGARLVEVVSGMVFTDFLRQRIFAPLELQDTTFWPNEEQASRFVPTTEMKADKSGRQDVLHTPELTPAAREKFSQGVKVPQRIQDYIGQDILLKYGRHFGEGDHGICSTAGDIGRFCQMLLNGGTWQGHRLLTPQAVQQMGSVQTGEASTTPLEAYGVGVFVTKNDKQGPAAGSFGHLGSHKTVMWVDPKNQLVMVLMVQSADMTKEQQEALYTPFFKAAVEKYGRR